MSLEDYAMHRVTAQNIRVGDRFWIRDHTGPGDTYRGSALHEVISIEKKAGNGYFFVGAYYEATTRLISVTGKTPAFLHADDRKHRFYVRTDPQSKTFQRHLVYRPITPVVTA